MTEVGSCFCFTPDSLLTRSNHPFFPSHFHTLLNADTIKEALKQVKYPGFSRDIVSFGLVRSASFADGTAQVSLAITTSDPKLPPMLKSEVEKCLLAQPGVQNV